MLNRNASSSQSAQPAGRKEKKSRLTLGAPVWFVLPAILLLAGLRTWPVFRSIQLSFTKWTSFGEPEWVGFDNFDLMLRQDPDFYPILWNTIEYSIIAAGGSIVLGFALAYALYRRIPYWNIFKVIFFLTYILSQASTAVVWKAMLDPLLGPISPALELIGIDAPIFLGDPDWALITIAIKSVWQYSAVPMIVFLAAMEDIPQNMIEAARIDGATNMQVVWQILVPLTRPVIQVMLLLQFVYSMRSFDSIWVMTEGGPGKASAVLGTEVFLIGFEQLRFGYASAWAVALTILIIILTFIYLRLLQRETVEY